MLKPFTTRRKRRGDNGNPYLSPLSGLNKGDVAPFIRIEKKIELIQFITQAMKRGKTPDE
jgi:hypothetical protein